MEPIKSSRSFRLLGSGIFRWALRRSRRQKQLLMMSIDSLLLMFCVWLSYAIRFNDFSYSNSDFIIPCLVAPIVTVPFLWYMNVYKTVIRYISGDFWVTLSQFLFISTCFWFVFSKILQGDLPRSTIFLYFILSLITIQGVRFVARRLLSDRSLTSNDNNSQSKRHVCIYGAGASGRSLAAAFHCGQEIFVTAFIDDDPTLRGNIIHGIPVVQPIDLEKFSKKQRVDEILLAIPSASRSTISRIVESLELKPFNVRNMPGINQLVEGDVRKAWFQGDYIARILGREKAEPNNDLLTKNISGKNVLVSGAGGSIGSELCRQIVALSPKCLVLFELSELALYQVEADLENYMNSQNIDVQIVGILGSVLDKNHLVHVFGKFKIDTVYHAAAYKHVPIVEYNMGSGLKNNIFGTLCAAEAAQEAMVGNFVLVSTDKAVRPTNTMGASKRMAELVVQAISKRDSNAKIQTGYSIVRFGNVLGSSGSVIPLFLKQIRTGGPVTVTHRDVNRYFMTTAEAASLVIQAGTMGKDGDVFVLDMGKPVKILDLAKRMIELAGLTLNDIPISITGLRPGEKLYEELLIGDNVSGTLHKQIMRASEESISWAEMKIFLKEIKCAIDVQDSARMRQLLCEFARGYEPTEGLVDFLAEERVNALNDNVSAE